MSYSDFCAEHYCGDEMKEDEASGIYTTNGVDEKFLELQSENRKIRYPFGVVDGRITIKWIVNEYDTKIWTGFILIWM
jgi:hypothetical protein